MVRQTKIGQAQSGVVVVGIVWRLPIAHANNEITRKMRRFWHHFLSSNVLRLSSCSLFSIYFCSEGCAAAVKRILGKIEGAMPLL